VPPVSVDDPVLGNLPQPQVIRHSRLSEIVLQPAVGLDQHILHDIAHIDPPLYFLVQPKLHHAPQAVTMPLHQTVDCVGVAPFGIGQQILSFFDFGPHRRIISAECRVRNAE
jgi:hypothetical protein